MPVPLEALPSLLGRPDSSQLSLTELGDYYSRMTDRIDIPILADGDTGFGNVTNVTRTVKVLERSGVGGFFIEDQVFKIIPLMLTVGKLAESQFLRMFL